MPERPVEKPRILLLLPTRTYRATDFLAAAMKLNVEVVVASEAGRNNRRSLAPRIPSYLISAEPNASLHKRKILEFAKTHPIAAIVGVDDDTTLLATAASKALRTPTQPRLNPPKPPAINTACGTHYGNAWRSMPEVQAFLNLR